MMAMTTATTIVVMMMTAIAVVMMMTTAVAVAVVATTAAALAAHVVYHVLNLLIGCLTVLKHRALEEKGAACQGVVGVNGNAVFLNIDDASHKALTFAVHQGDDSALEDVLVVKMSVYREDVAAHLVLAILLIFAKSVGWLECQLEVRTCLKTDDCLLELIDRHAEATDYLEWIAFLCFLYQLLRTISLKCIELIVY